MEAQGKAACPVCNGRLIEIRGKLVCNSCRTTCETCCEGGPPPATPRRHPE
jgi:hypothetical protein